MLLSGVERRAGTVSRLRQLAEAGRASLSPQQKISLPAIAALRRWQAGLGFFA
jgi:hypothetical protein